MEWFATLSLSCLSKSDFLCVMNFGSMEDVVKNWLLSCSRISSPGVAVTVGAALLVILWVSITTSQLLERKKLPPGPAAWPVVGNFPDVSGALPHRVLRSLAAKYGELMYLRLGLAPTIVVSSVAVSKELFQAHDATFLDRPRCLYFDIVTDGYKNMAVSNGRYWREVRKLLTSSLFTPKRLASYRSARQEEIHAKMKELRVDASASATGAHLVNLKSWLLGITCNSVTRMLVNKRYFGEGGEGEKEKQAFEAMVASMYELSGAFIIGDFVPYLRFLTKWQGWQVKMEALRDSIYSFGSRMMDIDLHRQRALHTNPPEANSVPDFVDVLLQTPLEDGGILQDKNLIMVLMLDLIAAGTETSATAVEWAVAELIQQPKLIHNLQAELTAVIGPKRVPQESDLPNLPFLQAVVKESLRLHPPATINLPRESTCPFTFRGYSFPQHTRLMLNFFAIHRDASVYGESAEQFRPERFMERPEVSAVAGFEFYELTPFSAGRRMCPAADLGYMMVSLMLAHLVHGFEWALPEGVTTVDMTEQFGLTVNMKKGLQLVAKPKLPAFLY